MAFDDERNMNFSASRDGEDPEVIRAEIERTRDRMSRTVDELGYRLNPDRLKGRMKQNLHDATVGKAENMARRAVYRADETRHTIVDSLRENPIPAAMIGIGLGWLMVNSRRDDDVDYRTYGYGSHMAGGRAGRYEVGYTTFEADAETDWSDDLSAQRYRAGIDDPASFDTSGGRASEMKEGAREKMDEVKDRARDQAHEMKDRVIDIADDARDFADRAHDRLDRGAERARMAASGLAQRTRRSTGRVEDRFDEAVHDTPLAIGAAAIALGMAVGLSVPSTRREAELMGPKRDQLLDRAREEAEEMSGRVWHVAERVVEEAKDTAREATREEFSDERTSTSAGFGATPTGGGFDATRSTGESTLSGSDGFEGPRAV